MDMSHTTVSELTDEHRRVAHGSAFGSMVGSDVTAQPLAADQTGDACRFGADVLLKRSGAWGGGKAILIDRRPRAQQTEFKHRLSRHAIILHLEGANSRTMFRYDGGPRMTAGCTLGQVMLIPAGCDVEGWSDYQARIRHIIVLLDPSLVDAEPRLGGNDGGLELAFQSDLNDGVIASRMRALQTELENPGLLGRLYIDSLSCEIAIRLVRMHAARPERLHRGGLSPRRLRLVKDYIAQNLANEISLADIAAVAGVSSGHFCRAFHKSAGVPSHRYVVRQRVELAKKLLTEGDTPIAQIALAAGFGNQSHLTRHFHAVVGTTPRRFRNEA